MCFKFQIFQLFFPICESRHYYLLCFDLKTNKGYAIDNIKAEDDSIDRYQETIFLLVRLLDKLNNIYLVIYVTKTYQVIIMNFTFQGELLVDYLEYKKHPHLQDVAFPKVERLSMIWPTSNNGKDCGIFMMRHMECFMGNGLKGLKCGFKREGEFQQKQLTCLRITYLKTILLSEFNTLRCKVEHEVETYEALPEETKKRLKAKALEDIEKRIEEGKNVLE